MSQVRLRFAPSPTGFLHIGGARTAIFNYLLARKLGGQFVLRIEDTDTARSKQEYEDEILNAMKWLGLSWDDSPLRQSLHKSFHRETVDELLERGAAYRDFLTIEEAKKLKDEAMRKGGLVAFRSPDRYLSPHEAEERAMNGEPHCVRFRIPDEAVIYQDGVHGRVEVGPDTLDDFVLLRQDRTPTYQVAVVADDYEMGISHVIRGDDHISNTPKQILIYKALSWKPPEFAHVPLILGSDRKRLSKRHGATAVTEYRNRGFLAESMLSYLALLGWSPGDDREIMTMDELVEAFDISGINNHSAIFDEQKLEWMNGRFISLKPTEELVEILVPQFEQKVSKGEIPEGTQQMLPIAVELLKSRVRYPQEVLEKGYYFFKDPNTIEDRKAAKKRLKDDALPLWLERLAEKYSELGENFNAQSCEDVLRSLAEELEIGTGKLIHPTRLAVSGQSAGPSLFEMLEALGVETVARRMRWLADFLREKGTPPDMGSDEDN